MLLETIRCENGFAAHLPYHQNRLNHALTSLGLGTKYDLASLIIPPSIGVYRCRFLYDGDHFQIEYLPYSPKAFHTFKCIDADHLSYPHKYADRTEIEVLSKQRDGCDDILIFQNGLLCDTSIANVALFLDDQWLTPEKPLLQGTTRERLLNEHRIITASLTREDLLRASRFAIMNAMIGFLEVESAIIH